MKRDVFPLRVPPESGAHAASASLQSICHYTLNNLIHLHKGGINFEKCDQRESCGFKKALYILQKVSSIRVIYSKGKRDEQVAAILNDGEWEIIMII